MTGSDRLPGSEIRSRDSGGSLKPEAAALVGYTVVLWVVRVVRHYQFGDLFDTAILTNVMWRLGNGFDDFTFITGYHHFASHASLVLPLFAPLFALSTPLGLGAVFLLQSASLGLVGWSVVVLGRSLGLTRTVGRLLAVAAVASPTALLVAQFDLNETTLGIGFLAMTVVTAWSGRDRGAVMWGVAAVACRVEMAGAVLLAGLVLWISGRSRSGRWVTLVGALAAVAYVAWLFGNPYATPSVAAHFGHLGATPAAVVSSLGQNPVLLVEPLASWEPWQSMLIWLLPFGIIAPLAGWRWLVPALPLVGVALFGVWPSADVFYHHYWYSLTALGAIAAAFGVERLAFLGRTIRLWLPVAMAAAWIAVGSIPIGLFAQVAQDNSDRRAVVQSIAAQEGFVAADFWLMPLLIDRPELTHVPRPFNCIPGGFGPYSPPNKAPDLVVISADDPVELTGLGPYEDFYQPLDRIGRYVVLDLRPGRGTAVTPCQAGLADAEPPEGR